MNKIALLLSVTALFAAEVSARVEGAALLPEGAFVEYEVYGWSKDEGRLALFARTVDDTEELEAMGGEVSRCPGYLNAAGEPFSGTLSLLLLEGGEVKRKIPILDGTAAAGKPHPSGCTPVLVRDARLKAAEAAAKELGVVKGARGTTVKGAEQLVVKDQTGAERALKLSTWVGKREDNEDGMSATLKGTIALRQDKRVVLRRKVKAEYNLVMAGGMSLAVGPILRSPSGKRLVVLVREQYTSGRGSSTAPFVFGAFEWVDGQLQPR